MLLSAVSILVVAQSSSEIPEGLMNNPVLRSKTLSLCLIKYHTMKAYGGTGGVAPRVRNLGGLVLNTRHHPEFTYTPTATIPTGNSSL